MSSDQSVETSKESEVDASDEVDPALSNDARSSEVGEFSKVDSPKTGRESLAKKEESNPAGEADSVLSRRVVYLAAALATAALVAAAFFGVLWWISASADNAGFTRERDEVLRVGSSVLRTVTELDYHNPDQVFDRSIAVSTDDFGKQITADRETRRQLLIQTKTIVTTTVLDAAVNELNADQGKANVMAALRVEIKQGDATVHKIIRIAADLTRVDQNGERSWKLSGIDPVAVVG